MELILSVVINPGFELIAASQCAPTLRVIEAKVFSDAGDVIKKLCRHCPKLTVLNLETHMGSMPDDSIVQTALQCCPLIEVLPTVNFNLTNRTLSAMASTRTLKQLKLSGSATYSSQAIQHILQASRSLTTVSLYGSHIDNALISCIGLCCRALRQLNISVQPIISDGVLVELFRGCRALEKLRLYRQGVVSGLFLSALFQYCPHLTDLHFASYSPNGVTTVALPQEVHVLDASYPSLKSLEVASTVTLAGLQSIFTHCTGLREVKLHKCDQLTDEAMKMLAQCLGLETLTLTYCEKNVTIAGMLEVVSHCSSLTNIELYGMPFNDAAFISLSLNCPNLSYFEMKGGKGADLITEAGIVAVAERCTRLKKFRLSHCRVEMTPTLELMNRRQMYSHICFGTYR